MVESMEGEAAISAINRASTIMPIMGVSAKHGHVPGGSGSSSSSSISSNSSGYDSATTTPTNNNYESASAQSSTSTTPVAIAEPIPLATIAAVTPYYNESASTQSLGVQHYQQQQQQQQQQQYCKQNYYHSYDYQQTSNVTGLASYDVSGRGGYDSGIGGSAPSFESYDSNVSGGLMHKPSTYRNIPNESNKTIPTNMSLEQPIQPQQQHQDYYLNNSMKSSNFLAQKNSAIMTNTGNKPQAAATPFFAQPYTQQYGNSSYYDTFRTKTPNEYHDPYADNVNAVTYQAQHKYYPTAKTQIKESCSILPNYTAMGVASKQYANDHAPGATANNFCNSNAVNHGLGSYDKYIYPTLNARPPSLTTNTPVNTTPYHSNGVHSTAPSPWPWPIENITNNNGSLSPTAVQSIGHIPTATVAPTQASYLNQNAITSQRKSPYRLHHEMYNDKYRTICPPGPPSQTQAYPQQTYISPAPPNRNLWSGSHPQNLPTYNERLPYASHHMTSGQGLHHSLAYFSANTGHTNTNNRQACCPQPFQPQPCYFSPRSQATMKTLENIPMPSQPTLIHRFSPYQTHCKYANMTDEKINNPNNLYLNTASYDSLPPTYGVHSNHTYAIGGNSNSYHGSNTAQEIMRAHSGPIIQHTTTSKNGSLTSIPFSNDLNLIPNAFGSYVTNPSNHNVPNINSQSHNLPPPVHGSNLAKRALMDYRKHINPTATQQPFSLPEDYYLNNLRDQGHHQPTINTKQCNSENILNTFDTTQEAINIIFDPTPEITDINAQKLLNDDGTKNLSLRDFIENWNDDEEDAIINEEMPSNINEVLCGISTMKKNPANNKEILSINQGTEQKDFNEDLLRDDTADTTDATDTTNQYAKLPDIVIDTEKSANCINLGNSSMAPSQSEPFALNSFDVEKELDQLQLKKCNSQTIAHFNEDTDDEMKGTNKNDIQLIPSSECSKNLDNTIISVQDPKAGISEATVSHVLCQDGGSDLMQKSQDNMYKDNDSSNSEHSLNSSGSTFEHEYHSFIHKLNTNVSSNSNKEERPECDKNNATFRNRFYKSINKYKHNEHKAVGPKSVQNLKYNSIFPLACTRKSRYKKLALSNKNKTKFKSTFYRFMHTYRRSSRLKLLQQHIYKLRDNHLPLIKGNSLKKFSIKRLQPRTLQAMCITVINTKDFRKYFLQNHAIRNCPNYVEIENTSNQSKHEKETPNAEDPHICTDPQCETCDVIRSLMESDKYESLVAINDNVEVQSYNQSTNTEPIDLSLESRVEESPTEITKLKNTENIVRPSKLTMESTRSNCLATSTTISREKEGAYGFGNSTVKRYNSECLDNFKTSKVLGEDEGSSSRLERNNLTNITKENFINEKNVENINNNFIERQREQSNIEEKTVQTNLNASAINKSLYPLCESISTKQQNNILEDRMDCNKIPRSIGDNTGEKIKPLENVQSLDTRDENNFVHDNEQKVVECNKLVKDNNNCSSETNAYITPDERVKESENQYQHMSQEHIMNQEEAMACNEPKEKIFEKFKNDEMEHKVVECNNLVKDNDNCSNETDACITPGELVKESENQNQNMSQEHIMNEEEAMVCNEPKEKMIDEFKNDATVPKNGTNEPKEDIFNKFKNDEMEHKVVEGNKLVKDNDNCSSETDACITPGELVKESENQNMSQEHIMNEEEAMVCNEPKAKMFDKFKNNATAPKDGTNESKKEIFKEFKNSATASEDGTIDCKNTLKNEIVDENMEDALENIKQEDMEIEFVDEMKTLNDEQESRGYQIEDGSCASSSLGEDFKGFKEQNTKQSFEEDSGESFIGFADKNTENNTSNEQPLQEPNESFDIMDTLDTISTSSSKIFNSTELSNDQNKSDNVSSELNELEALKKELIQNDYNMEQATNEEQFGEQSENLNENGPNITTNDIEQIKQMLESDDELPKENNAGSDETVVKHNIMVTNDKKKDINPILTETIIIPKLSDLSRDALNSSSEFNSFSNISPTQSTTNDPEVEREMTVEEALAEMYRQAGVVSDSDDATSVKNVFDYVEGDDGGNDDDFNQTNNTHNTQDIFLVNLQEILNSDSDVYIVQCDMNETILDVVDEGTNAREFSSVEVEPVNTLQWIKLPSINDSCSTAVDNQKPETSARARKRLSYDINEINFIPVLTEPDQAVSMIHHEEIVPDNFKEFLREEFFKYLHEKYVQRSIPRFYHANRILKKYKKFIYKKKSSRPTANP